MQLLRLSPHASFAEKFSNMPFKEQKGELRRSKRRQTSPSIQIQGAKADRPSRSVFRFRFQANRPATLICQFPPFVILSLFNIPYALATVNRFRQILSFSPQIFHFLAVHTAFSLPLP